MVPKLWVTVCEVTDVKLLVTVAFWSTVIFSNPEPSPEKNDAVTTPVPKSTSWLERLSTTWAEEEIISVELIVTVLSVTSTEIPP